MVGNANPLNPELPAPVLENFPFGQPTGEQQSTVLSAPS
jgi:hypothetical protein